MTEKEKCRQGLLYDANYDRELLAERERAKELLYDYNRLRPSQYAEKTDLLRSLLGKVGNQVIIEPPFNCDYGYNIEVGENFYANVNLVILDGAKVTIGDNAFIAPNVGIYTAGHPLDAERRNQGLEYAYPIRIGSNVWCSFRYSSRCYDWRSCGDRRRKCGDKRYSFLFLGCRKSVSGDTFVGGYGEIINRFK